MIGKVLLIANPASRRGDVLVLAAERAFAKAGVRCDVVLTERSGHAREIAAGRAHAYDAVFSLGGDGTAMEVATALAGTGRPLGVLPGGTGNLLARAVGTPLRIRPAVKALLAGDRLDIDLGRTDTGHRFAIAAGVGIDASMVAQTPPALKRRLGVLAYTLIGTRAAVRAVRRREFISARVTVDGTVVTCEAAAILVANFGAMLSDRLTLGEGIRADDGVMDVCIFTPGSLGDAIRIMWRMVRRDFSPTPVLRYLRGRQIRIDADPHCMTQADGDLLGPTPLIVEVEPRALRLLVPAGRR